MTTQAPLLILTLALALGACTNSKESGAPTDSADGSGASGDRQVSFG